MVNQAGKADNHKYPGKDDQTPNSKHNQSSQWHHLSVNVLLAADNTRGHGTTIIRIDPESKCPTGEQSGITGCKHGNQQTGGEVAFADHRVGMDRQISALTSGN
tara:strand:+ start:596 stop:907 length:312 start_codon:yes stop_codon:yes gene_type:complete